MIWMEIRSTLSQLPMAPPVLEFAKPGKSWILFLLLSTTAKLRLAHGFFLSGFFSHNAPSSYEGLQR
jgi:hypothetical protein